MISSKHKVGDKVKIRSLEWYNQNKDERGYVGFFVPPMAKYCGKEATIVESLFKTRILDIDDQFWYWTDEMFEES